MVSAMSLEKQPVYSCLQEFKVNRCKHRSILETDVELLTCAKVSVCLTKLMYTCNMSFKRFNHSLCKDFTFPDKIKKVLTMLEKCVPSFLKLQEIIAWKDTEVECNA